MPDRATSHRAAEHPYWPMEDQMEAYDAGLRAAANQHKGVDMSHRREQEMLAKERERIRKAIHALPVHFVDVRFHPHEPEQMRHAVTLADAIAATYPQDREQRAEADVPYSEYPGERGKETPWGERIG